MGGRRTEGHITYPRNERTEESSRMQRKMEVFSKGFQSPGGDVEPAIDGWVVGSETAQC
jgi:hypothetical protein